MASADILRAARARIEDPKNWTKGVFARDKDGNEISSRSPKAVCWCSIGAIRAEDHSDDTDACGYLFDAADNLYGITNPATVNDDMDHDAVVAMFDAAIAAAEAEAGR